MTLPRRDSVGDVFGSLTHVPPRHDEALVYWSTPAP
jgi:hypothetical protein